MEAILRWGSNAKIKLTYVGSYYSEYNLIAVFEVDDDAATLFMIKYQAVPMPVPEPDTWRWIK